MIVALRQGSERAGLFLYMPEEHAAEGRSQRRAAAAMAARQLRLLLDAVFRVWLQPCGSWHLRRAQRLAVPPAERASSALRCARQYAGDAQKQGVCRWNVLDVHVTCFSQMCGARQCERK